MVLLCHIVGLNSLAKQLFIEFITQIDKNKEIVVRDLDEISLKVIKSKTTIQWKYELETKINNLLKMHTNKKVIFVGLCTNYQDLRIRVNIGTVNKFFVSIDPLLNAKQTIKYNITNHVQQIINGDFPLDHLDHKFLIKQYDTIHRLYSNKNMAYKLKSYDSIKKWCEIMISNYHILDYDFQNVTLAIIATTAKFTNYIYKGFHNEQLNLERIFNAQKKYLYAYPTKWMALFSMIDKQPNILKGIQFVNNKRIIYIKELKKNVFNNLPKICNFYYVETKFMDKKGYRYVSDKKLKIIKSHVVTDILSELKKDGVDVIYFK